MRPILLLAVLATTPALAAPGFIPIQGVLTDSGGTVIDGAVDVTFTLYSDSAASTSLWSDTVTVDVVGGAFATELGGNIPLDLATFENFPAVHLQIQVAGDTPMPLVPLDHVPYAARAEWAANADRLGGQALADIQALIPATTDIEAVCFDNEAELTAVLDDNYLGAAYVPAWGDLTGVPAGFSDGTDDGFTTEAELAALLDDNYLAASYTPAWGQLTGVPSGFADGTDDGFTTESQLTSLLDNNYVASSNGTAANLTTTGTLDSFAVRVSSTDDVAEGNYDGGLIIGASGAANLGIDQNEIMARDASTNTAGILYLQNNGGKVQTGANLQVGGSIAATTTSLSCQWSPCFDTGGSARTCAALVPGYPIVGGIDIATQDAQFPAGCTSTNHEDEARLYCCRLPTSVGSN